MHSFRHEHTRADHFVTVQWERIASRIAGIPEGEEGGGGGGGHPHTRADRWNCAARDAGKLKRAYARPARFVQRPTPATGARPVLEEERGACDAGGCAFADGPPARGSDMQARRVRPSVFPTLTLRLWAAGNCRLGFTLRFEYAFLPMRLRCSHGLRGHVCVSCIMEERGGQGCGGSGSLAALGRRHMHECGATDLDSRETMAPATVLPGSALRQPAPGACPRLSWNPVSQTYACFAIRTCSIGALGLLTPHASTITTYDGCYTSSMVLSYIWGGRLAWPFHRHTSRMQSDARVE